MDFLFVNPVGFDNAASPQIGQLILYNIIKDKYEAAWVNFDILNQSGKFAYNSDMDENIHNMAGYISKLNPKIVGFYTICNSFDIAIELAMQLKKNVSGTLPKIVLGGPHASVLSKDILDNFDCVDVICVGESEKIILPLVDALLNAETPLITVPGIVFRDSDGIVKETDRPPFLSAEELGEHTVFDYGTDYKVNPKYLFSLEGGRGCPYHCTFCSTSTFWGSKHRVKPVRNLIAEMDEYHKRYGVRNFSIVHDHFTANRKYILDFCSEMKKNDYEWACSSRADILDYDILLALKQSGCSKIYIGIETGSQKMQKEINKNLNIAKAKTVIQLAKELGIYVTVSFIYCFPNESVADFKETIHFIEDCLRLDVDIVQLHKFCLYAGSAESEKVPLENLYFDESDMRTLKVEKNAFSTNGLELVRKMPNIFLQHYTFKTEVSERYKHFDLLLMVITLLFTNYRRTIKHLLSICSLLDIYANVSNELVRWDQEFFQNSNRRAVIMYDSEEVSRCYGGASRHLLLNTCRNDPLAEALFMYEDTCRDFMAQKELVALVALNFSFAESIQSGTFTPGRTYIKLEKTDGTLTASKLTCIAYELLQNSGIKVLEFSGVEVVTSAL